MRLFQRPAGICDTSDCLPAPVKTGVLVKNSVLLATLSLCTAGICSEQFPFSFSRWSFNKALSVPLPRYGQRMLPMFPARVVPDYSIPTFANVPRAGSGPVSGCEEPSLANYHLFHFHQFQCVLAPIHWTRSHRQLTRGCPPEHFTVLYCTPSQTLCDIPEHFTVWYCVPVKVAWYPWTFYFLFVTVYQPVLFWYWPLFLLRRIVIAYIAVL